MGWGFLGVFSVVFFSVRFVVIISVGSFSFEVILGIFGLLRRFGEVDFF